MTVGDRVVGEIGPGLLALVGVERATSAAEWTYIASKIRDLRIFEDEGDERPQAHEPFGGRYRRQRARGLAVHARWPMCDEDAGRRSMMRRRPRSRATLYEDVVRELRASGLRSRPASSRR